MNFRSYEKQIFKSFDCTKISLTQNEPKRAETKKRNPQLVTEHARATPRHTVIGGS